MTAGVPEGRVLKVVLDVKTRWNSVYLMLERLIKLLPYISSIMLEFADSPAMITSQEKELISEILLILRPMKAMTDEISGEKYATLSLIILMVHCAREQLKKLSSRNEIVLKFKKTILAELQRRFGTVESVFLVAAATILDPRFKKIHFTDSLAYASALKKLKGEMGIDESSDSSSDTSVSGIEDFDLWVPHKSLSNSRKQCNSSNQYAPDDEFRHYLNQPVAALNCDPLIVWHDMRAVYPKLYSLSLKYCLLLGSSVSCERLFSQAGSTINEKRNRLLTKRLGKILFLNSWMKMGNNK